MYYLRFVLNVQAMYDLNRRISYMPVAGPGKMNNARAFCRLMDLKVWINKLEVFYTPVILRNH